MVWYFIGVYVINRTLHGRLEIRNFSSSCQEGKTGPLIYQKRIRPHIKANQNGFKTNFSDEEGTFNWELAYLMAQRCTKRTKLIEFQFKLLHRRILLTNDFLLKTGRKVNDNCTFCNNSSETLIHLFWSCHVTSSFWKSVTDFQLQNAVPLIGKYNLLNITALGLRQEPHSTEYSCQLNYCLLLVRFHIWQAKMDEISPSLANFLCLVKQWLKGLCHSSPVHFV